MKTLKSYPGVLTMLVLAIGFAINGLVDYINYEIAGPSFLAAVALTTASTLLIALYEGKRAISYLRLKPSKKVSKKV